MLTLVALAIAPALWLIAIASRRKLFPASWDAQQKEAQVAGVVDGAVTGVRVVKGFGQEEQEIERLEGVSTRLYSARLRVVRLTARYNPALGAVPMLGQVGVLALGGWLALHGSIKIGVFLAFSLYIGQMVAPVRALTSLITIGQEARASVIRVLRGDRLQAGCHREARRGGPAAAGHPTSSWTTWPSATCRPSRCCEACRCTCRRARRSPWSAPQARESPRSPCCCPASTTSGAARSGSAARTSAT